MGFGTPFVCGKDSLNNEFRDGDKTIVIPDTLLISAFAVMPDYRQAVTMDLKKPGSALYLVGTTRWELGGSHLGLVKGVTHDSTVPLTDPVVNRKLYDSLHAAVVKCSVLSAHDLSEGGLAVALAEMAFTGQFGAEVDVLAMDAEPDLKDPMVLLFSESTGRILVEVPSDQAAVFETCFKGQACRRIGSVNTGSLLTLKAGSQELVSASLEELKASWKNGFREALR
ncbi:MAG: AIR synthase-related protein [Planctomycetota bacterium]